PSHRAQHPGGHARHRDRASNLRAARRNTRGPPGGRRLGCPVTGEVPCRHRRDPDPNPRHRGTYQESDLFCPVVGDESLPETPLRAAARGATAKVDLLVGHNLHEYRLFTEMGQSVEIDDEETLQTTASRAGLGTDALATYREMYPDASLHDLYSAIMGDAMFNEFTVRLAETHAKGGGRAHVFRLAAESPALGGRLGA